MKMRSNSVVKPNQPIDVVIAWVDGDDPILAEKRSHFLKTKNENTHQGAKPTRFASLNEIKYCVLSILTFAPFVRNVFIVTDNQDPKVLNEVKKHFPEKVDCIKIVDHKEIFSDFEQYLPTFNSISIGNMIWRIEGLSENFVYFNDDVFLVRDVKPEDWVIDGRPVMRGYWTLPPYIKLIKDSLKKVFFRGLLNKKNYTPKFSFRLVQWNAAYKAGMRFRLFFNCHTPHVVNKNTIESFFQTNRPVFEKNISFRFREQDQFNMTTLANHLEIASGNKNTAKLNLGYLVPSYYSKQKMKRKIKRVLNDSRIKSVCVQSLDSAKKEDQIMIFSLMDQILGIKS